MAFTLQDLSDITGGVLVQGDESRQIGRISTDTRRIKAGEVFVGLNGKNFKGRDFIQEALRYNIGGIVVDGLPETVTLPPDVFCIITDDTTQSFGRIARAWRDFIKPRVVGVTGSAGKTTTKEMISAICRNNFQTLATEGNLNNLIGLPITLLNLKAGDQVAVIEFGMSTPGELAELTRICNPDISVITNVGNAHIGNFGSLDGLIAGEAEIFEEMAEDSLAIVNLDCANVSLMRASHRFPKRVLTYGTLETAEVRATKIRPMQPVGYEFEITYQGASEQIAVPIYGRYSVLNALAAAAVALSLGLDLRTIATGLSKFTPPKMRSETEYFDGILIVADCYNASPDAMAKSVRSFADLTGVKRRVAVLGDMLELGTMMEELHHEVGAAIKTVPLDLLVTVGITSRLISDVASRGSYPCVHFESRAEAAEFLHRELKSNDGLLVKGSRGAKLEEVLQALKQMRSEQQTGKLVSGATDVREFCT